MEGGSSSSRQRKHSDTTMTRSSTYSGSLVKYANQSNIRGHLVEARLEARERHREHYGCCPYHGWTWRSTFHYALKCLPGFLRVFSEQLRDYEACDVLFELCFAVLHVVYSLAASNAYGLCVVEQGFVYHVVEEDDYAGSADAALEAFVDVGPDGSAVGALRLYPPEVAQRLYLPDLEEHG